MLVQRGDHACSEWNDQGCLFGGRRNGCGGNTATGVTRLLQRFSRLQQPDHLRYIMMQISIWFSFFLLICFVSLFDGMMESHCCLCKCYNAYVSIETPIFYFISNAKQFFLFLIWHYLLHRILYFGCSKHHVQFSLMLHVTIILVCFTLVVPFLFILPLFWLSC